jgi:hypothetical protein
MIILDSDAPVVARAEAARENYTTANATRSAVGLQLNAGTNPPLAVLPE